MPGIKRSEKETPLTFGVVQEWLGTRMRVDDHSIAIREFLRGILEELLNEFPAEVLQRNSCLALQWRVGGLVLYAEMSLMGKSLCVVVALWRPMPSAAHPYELWRWRYNAYIPQADAAPEWLRSEEHEEAVHNAELMFRQRNPWAEQYRSAITDGFPHDLLPEVLRDELRLAS